jgi:nucleoside-diphosphate-sugar epimerase
MADGELHVIFGTGPVGMAVMEALRARGKKIRMVNRSGSGTSLPGVEIVKGEAANPLETIKICRGAEVVYSCASPPYTMWPEIFPLMQRGVIEGAAASGAKLVVMENLYMYGATDGQPLSEETPCRAADRKGMTRAAMAREIREVHKLGKVRTVSARASDFFGPRVLRSVMGERIFYPALENRPARFAGNIDLPHTYTFIEDIGKALVTLGEHDEALGQTWHIPSAETVSTRRFIEIIYRQTGRTPQIKTLSKFTATLLGMLSPVVRELAEIMYQYKQPLILDHSKFVSNFGNHSTPLAEAIRITLDWYRRNPRSSPALPAAL